jgi:hypothetical protein
LYRYELEFNKAAILPFYQKLLAEARTTEDFSSLFEDAGLVNYLKSKEFDAVFDYHQSNTTLILWTDKEGFPALMEYKFRLVPGDDAEQLKDKQAELVFTIKISDINQPIIIEAPVDAKNIDEVGGSVFKEASDKATNAAIKAYLSGTRASAEIYYMDNNSYGKTSLTGGCEVAGTLFHSEKNIAQAISSIKEKLKDEENSKIVCYGTSSAWAISANLIKMEGEDGYWCVDSTGSSKSITKMITSTSCN